MLDSNLIQLSRFEIHSVITRLTQLINESYNLNFLSYHCRAHIEPIIIDGGGALTFKEFYPRLGLRVSSLLKSGHIKSEIWGTSLPTCRDCPLLILFIDIMA